MCFWLGTWGVLGGKKTGRTDKIRCSVKNLPFCVGCWRVLDYNWRANSKHSGKVGILVKIYIFSRNTMVFLCGICLFTEKMTLFFFYPYQIAIYSCPVPSGVVSNNWVSCKVYQFWVNSLHENTWFVGEWTRSYLNQCPHHGDVAKKNTFFTKHLPVTTSEYCVYFLLELKGVDVRL